MFGALFLRDEGDGGGNEPEPTPGTQEPNEPNPTPGSDPGDGGATPPKEPTSEEMKKELEALRAEKENLTTKLGRQSKDVGIVRQINEGLKKDPKGLIAALAKKANQQVFFDDPNKDDPLKSLTEGEDGDRFKGITTEIKALKERNAYLEQQLGTGLNAVLENHFRNEHKDWDDLSETRETIKVGLDSGQMNQAEVLHLAARGFHSAEALEAARKQGEKDAIEKLRKKNAEQIESGGERFAPASDTTKFEELLKQLD